MAEPKPISLRCCTDCGRVRFDDTGHCGVCGQRNTNRVLYQPDSEQRYTVEEWKERLFEDEPILAMLTLLGECDWGLLHTDPGAVDPVSLVQTTSTDLRAALEAAFNKTADHSEEGGG